MENSAQLLIDTSTEPHERHNCRLYRSTCGISHTMDYEKLFEIKNKNWSNANFVFHLSCEPNSTKWFAMEIIDRAWCVDASSVQFFPIAETTIESDFRLLIERRMASQKGETKPNASHKERKYFDVHGNINSDFNDRRRADAMLICCCIYQTNSSLKSCNYEPC